MNNYVTVVGIDNYEVDFWDTKKLYIILMWHLITCFTRLKEICISLQQVPMLATQEVDKKVTSNGGIKPGTCYEHSTWSLYYEGIYYSTQLS